MSWVYTYSHFLAGNINKDEWEMYEELFTILANGLVENSSVIFLDYSVETLMYRLKLRGRDYELKYYTQNYLLQLQAGLMALKERLKLERVKLVQVNEREVGDFVQNGNDLKTLTSIIKRKII
jgi:deoxyguanosine kinase